MQIRIVVAIGQNGEMGEKGRLPWNLPDDLAHFRALTLGKPVIMGRETFESLGKPLPKRLNIVLTRNKGYSAPGIVVVSSFSEALAKAEQESAPEVCVIGGSGVCATALPVATHLSLTRVYGDFPTADTFFPEVNWAEWEEVARISHPMDDRHACPFDFVEFVRKIPSAV